MQNLNLGVYTKYSKDSHWEEKGRFAVGKSPLFLPYIKNMPVIPSASEESP
jgi:hypothetical protein